MNKFEFLALHRLDPDDVDRAELRQSKVNAFNDFISNHPDLKIVSENQTSQEWWDSCEDQKVIIEVLRSLPELKENKKFWVQLAINIARSVLHLTNDPKQRPLRALQAAERWTLDPSEENRKAANAAAYAAANAAYADAAYADAAYAAAYAAANAAYAAANAAYADAAYADAAYADAAYAAAYADAAYADAYAAVYAAIAIADAYANVKIHQIIRNSFSILEIENEQI